MPMGAPSAGDTHVDRPVELRTISQEQRDKIPAEDFAGKDRSYFIEIPSDVHAAASSIGRAGNDNHSSDTLKVNIIRIAKRKGAAFTAQLPQAWKDELKLSGDFDEILTGQLHGFPIHLSTVAGDTPKSWIQVARTGDFVSSRYGEFSITPDTLRTMVQNFRTVMPKAPTRLPVDYDHLSMEPQHPGDGKAAGWFTDLQLRSGDTELWGLVEWTPDAADAIQKKEYQGVSPSFARNYKGTDGKKVGTTLLAAAITNHPFLEGMAPLTLRADGDLAIMLSRGDTHIMAKKMLSLKDSKTGQAVDVDPDDLEATDYMKSLRSDMKDLKALADKAPKDGEKVVKMSDVADAGEVISLRGKVTEMSTEVTSLRTELTTERETRRIDLCGTKFDALVRAGKALPSEKDFAISLAKEKQTLFDGWAATKTTVIVKLDRTHGVDAAGDETKDPVENLISLVAAAKKDDPKLSESQAWDIVCTKHPEAYADYRKATSQRV